MDIREYMKDHLLILDGGMGTMLQHAGLRSGEPPERFCLSRPEEVYRIHRSYYEAGANVVSTNTFGLCSLRFSDTELPTLARAAVELAKRAREGVSGDSARFIAFDVGPLGRLLEPLGDLPFERAVEIFGEVMALGEEYGADLIFIETMSDTYEMKAALLAAKEYTSLPVFVSCAFGADGKLLTGASPEAVVALLEGMGADAIGANCSQGPDLLLPIAERMLAVSSVPIILKPNAGLPTVVCGETVYDTTPDAFAKAVLKAVQMGVRAVGGCCGTTPDYIRASTNLLEGTIPVPVTPKQITVVSSYTHTVVFDGSPIIVGERINPTGKKQLASALRSEDYDYLIGEAVGQVDHGAHVLDVNVGLPDIDEASVLARTVGELQAVTNVPLQLDSANPQALERALRLYNGKALVNSVSGKEESLRAILPLVKKYGGVLIALTLDEDGIPADAEGRIRIAKKILRYAEEYGISKKDLIFDPLALTVSTGAEAPRVTLETVGRLHRELGVKTSLGVSNVSYGLPLRDGINAAFFTMAMAEGLDAAIINPYSVPMMNAYRAYRVLKGLDESAAEYIASAGSVMENARIENTPLTKFEDTSLKAAIIDGRKKRAYTLAKEALALRSPLGLIREEIVPALDFVGKGYEEKTLYLPSLLVSAEAAKAAFEAIRETATGEEVDENAPVIILATVRGDIHDIGKNIVKLILDNYGFRTVDLGRDIPPERVRDAVLRHDAIAVGLSALMTTTVPAMEETIRMLHADCPGVPVMVGGAVLTSKYAKEICADFYAKDAMEGLRIVQNIANNSLQNGESNGT